MRVSTFKAPDRFKILPCGERQHDVSENVHCPFVGCLSRCFNLMRLDGATETQPAAAKK